MSTSWTKTPITSIDNLKQIIGALQENGGELGLGLIRSTSNKGLVRLRISSPPPSPLEPKFNDNVFKRAQQRQAYEVECSRYDKAIEERKKDIDERVKVFLSSVEPLLKQPANARQTDVWGALRRGRLFLAEPDSAWTSPPLAFVVLISDGIDTTKSRPVSLDKNITLILVNGSSSEGSLASSHPVCFESVESAFRFIVSAKGGQ